jgi:hypothetical protein
MAEAGIYPSMPAATYHADPCPAPSLSSTIARCLLDRSPLHAWAKHPRLGNMKPLEPTPEMDDGSVLHHLILGVGAELAVVDAPDWRSKGAREERVASRAAGRIPVLIGRYVELGIVAEEALARLALHVDYPAPFRDGMPETAMLWEESGTWCRALVDWLPTDAAAPLVDLKTTRLGKNESAAPQAWERRMIDRYALQAAFYCRGAARLRGREPAGMLFVVVETDPPYAVSIVSPAPSLMAHANAEVDEALAVWRACLAANEWPGYPPYTSYVEAPGWLEMRREERQQRAEWMRQQGAEGRIAAWNRIAVEMGRVL